MLGRIVRMIGMRAIPVYVDDAFESCDIFDVPALIGERRMNFGDKARTPADMYPSWTRAVVRG